MRKLLLVYSLLCATASFAQLNGDGYYRIQNYMSGRYAYIMDNRGSINFTSTTADLNALTLWLGHEKTLADPATVIYVKKQSGNGYNLTSQGTGTYDIIGHYINIQVNANGTCKAYASKSGMVKYLCDADQRLDREKGAFGTNGTGDWRNWNLLPISASSDNYFGIKPTIEANGKYYTSFYAEFPFSFYSSGMKAYTVESVQKGAKAIIVPFEGDIIPAKTPLIIECSSADPSDNRINLLTSTLKAPAGNILKGNFFLNDVSDPRHRNVRENDPATMRLLGLTADGKLGFVAAPDVPFVPANSAYLTVSATDNEEMEALTYDEFLAAVPSVAADATTKFNVYTPDGVAVRLNATTTDGLRPGIYIVNHKKVIIR